MQGNRKLSLLNECFNSYLSFSKIDVQCMHMHFGLEIIVKLQFWANEMKKKNEENKIEKSGNA